MAEIAQHVRALREGDDAAKTAAARTLRILAWNNPTCPEDLSLRRDARALPGKAVRGCFGMIETPRITR